MPDIVMKKYRTCIFINGCFWHAHNVSFANDNDDDDPSTGSGQAPDDDDDDNPSTGSGQAPNDDDTLTLR